MQAYNFNFTEVQRCRHVRIFSTFHPLRMRCPKRNLKLHLLLRHNVLECFWSKSTFVDSKKKKKKHQVIRIGWHMNLNVTMYDYRQQWKQDVMTER